MPEPILRAREDRSMTSTEPSSDRIRLRRMAQRGAYDRAAVFDVLDRVANHQRPVTAPWDNGRAPSETELRQTLVVAVELVEMSAKVRTGDPIDEPTDVDGPHWAGYVPIVTSWGDPVPAADLGASVEVPAVIASRAARPLYSASRPQDAPEHEQGDDGDDLTAEDDAIDVDDWAPADVRPLDHVDAGGLGDEAETTART
jgi:hypothetical protein